MTEKDQSLTVDAPSCPCLVLADRGRLEQALLNLLSNACKFTPRQGHIAVALHDEGEEYVVSVADDGPGIPLEEQAPIFERFYSRSRGPGREAGAGLGLAITKTVVELHGGRIWMKSQIDHGSTFYFAVPKEGRNEDTRRG
jgi:signal transduction histidine kinase